MAKTFSITLPSYIKYILENEFKTLFPDISFQTLISDQLVIGIPETDYLNYAHQNSQSVFTMSNFQLLSNIIVCEFQFGTKWKNNVTLLQLPPPFRPDAFLHFSPIQSKALSFQVYADHSVYIWEQTTMQFLDNAVNLLKLPDRTDIVPAPPSVSKPPLTSASLLSDQRSTAAIPSRPSIPLDMKEDLKEIFKEVSFDPVSLSEKLQNNKTITTRDNVLLVLAINGIIDIELQAESS